MSRAVIDQAGFRIFFIGLIISLILGLALKSQIAPNRVLNVLQDSISRLEKDFLIDFKSAEVVLSKWGLPLPYLEISQIRLSPKKMICQDSQLYIDRLIVPLGLWSLFTAKSLITEISTTSVELRIAEINNCLIIPDHNIPDRIIPDKNNVLSAPLVSKNQSEIFDEKSFFEIKTAALLNKINIDQLKIIYKKYPEQTLDLRQVQVDLVYKDKQIAKVKMNSQVYAFKDPLSTVHYFKGDLGLQLVSHGNEVVEGEAKLNGRMLDGEFKIYSLYNSVDKSIKTDFTANNIALKPFVQINLIASSWLNYPVTFSFRGFGQYYVNETIKSQILLKDIVISGDRTYVSIPEIQAIKINNKFEINAFEADIQKFNLNKIIQSSQMQHMTQSIDDYGDFQGKLNFKDLQHGSINGSLRNLKLIFSNRGRREIQKIDSFSLVGLLNKDSASLKLSNFMVNNTALDGKAEINHNFNNLTFQGDAQFNGKIFNEKIWTLLTQLPQSPLIKLHWTFKKADEERHQLYLYMDELSTQGINIKNTEIQMIQSFQNGLSSALAVNIKSGALLFNREELTLEPLKKVFNPEAILSELSYASSGIQMYLKGPDWKNMGFEFESKLKDLGNLKSPVLVKSKGDWNADESLSGIVTLQSSASLKRFEIIKKENASMVIQPL